MAADQHPGYGIGHSISPGVPAPETVMVALMTDGGYVLVGRGREMPVAFVAPGDAAPLRCALEAAFGNDDRTSAATRSP